MIFERIIEMFLSLVVSGFAMAWLGIMVSAAASVPVVGFAMAIPAGLVVYAVRASVTGKSRARIEQRHPG